MNMANDEAHLDGMAIVHQQLVPAEDVARFDDRVRVMLQHGRYQEALAWLDEVLWHAS